MAYFRTRIGLRNALQEEISGSSDKEAVLITLNRPIVFAQPVAFDRGSSSSFPPSAAQRAFFPAPLSSRCLLSCSRALLAELQGGVRQLERAALGPQQGHPHGHQGGGGQAARHPADVRPGLQHPLPAADRQRPGHLPPHHQHVSGEPASST